MGKLSKDQVAKLAKIGITKAKSVEDSREQMVKKMVELGIEDDGESWDDVWDIVSTLLEDPEADNDELAKEVEDEDEEDEDEEEEEEDEEDEDEEEEEEDEEEGDEEDEEEEDEEDEDDEDSEDEEEEDEEDEEEEEEAPKKKSPKKEEQKKSLKKEEKKPVKEEAKKPTKKEEAKKPVKEEAKKSPKKAEVKKVSKRLDPKNSKEDAAHYDGLKKALSKYGEFEYNFIANGGVSIKYIGQNSTKVFFSFDSPKLIDDKAIGRVYSSAIKQEEKLIELFGEDFEVKQDWSGIPIMVEISLEEIIEALKDNKDIFTAFLKTLEGKDVKLGKNRDKMEAQLKDTQKDKAKDIKKSAKKKVEEVEDEEEEEDEEEKAPKKKSSKKKVEEEDEEEEEGAPKKKSSKKEEPKKSLKKEEKKSSKKKKK